MEKYLQHLQTFANYIVANTHFDVHSVWFRLLILLVLVLLLSFLVNFFLAGSVLGAGYRVFVAPGIILHELSHAFFCLITGAKITKISLFDKDGGSVEHSQPKIPVLGPILISLAPFAIGIATIFIFARLLGFKEAELGLTSLSYDNIILFLKNSFLQIDFHNYQNLLLLYLTLSVAVTMTPSKQDIKNIAVLLFVIICAGFALLQFTHLYLPFSFIPVAKAVLLLNTVIILLILSLAFSIIVFGLSKLIKK